MVSKTGTSMARRYCSPCVTTGALCHIVTSTPAIRMPLRTVCTARICAVSSSMPEMAKASTLAGMMMSSLTEMPAIDTAVKPGGQSMMT